MDFEDAKENIQPLAAGRNASILQAALQAESHQELQQQRRQYEDAIKNYEGDDPLEAWFEYIYWIEQSFPSGGKESGLEEVLLKCLTKFEKDERYHQDRRMIKLYIKYIDTHENPQECYQQLYNQGIGTMVADLYICWAYYYDLSGNFRKADEIFRKGIDCRAQPFEELQEAHQHFGFTVSQRILYDDDNSKQKYQSNLEEKRHALTSLRAHRKKVGSVRTGAAVKSHVPGKVHVNSAATSRSGNNTTVRIFEDENKDPNAIVSPELPAPEVSRSVVKTILDSARKQENVKEPGPWNKAYDKKKGKLFASDTHADLGFEILEDDESMQPIRGKINYGKPFIYFDGFVPRNDLQEEWILPVTLENEQVPRSYPSYDKCLLYPQPNMEFSLEELGCYYWYKKRNIENKFTKKYDMVWKSTFNSGIRMYPNFTKKSILPPEEPKGRYFNPMEANVEGKCKLVFDPKLCYPDDQKEELQFEEAIYQRWKRGERKLKYDGNETVAMVEEMEETVCLPKESARRKSFFPTRKSCAPQQFAHLATNLEESEEANSVLPTASFSRRSVIMKTPKKVTEELSPPEVSVKPAGVKLSFDTDEEERGVVFFRSPESQIIKPSVVFAKTPKKITPGTAPDTYEDDEEPFAFKTPAAPILKQQKVNFQIYEEEENNYEANETCSTQMFNCFIKAQSVSTPKAPTKILKPPATDRQPTNLNFSGIENAPLPANPNPTIAFSPPEYNEAGLTLQGKQLSTIMETSEQTTTGNTASIKSSGSAPDLEAEAQQSRVPLTNNICTLETVQEAGSLAEKDSAELLLMKSLRLVEDTPTVRRQKDVSRFEQKEDTVPTMPTLTIFEDRTETIPKIQFAKAGNFSRLEDREDTAPSIRPVRFQEDKTETITKMVVAPKKMTIDQICPDEEMFEFFAKSPEKAKTALSVFTPPPPATANKSLFSVSAFMNFRDSPEPKQKCNYDSPEVRNKHGSLAGPKKGTNLSFLPDFDDPMEDDKPQTKKDMQSSFLPDLSMTSGEQKIPKAPAESSLLQQKSMLGKSLRQPPEKSFLSGLNQPHQSKELSFLPGLSKAEGSFITGGVNRRDSAEESFLLEFQNASIGASKAPEKSLMPISRPSQAKKTGEESFMKSFTFTRINSEPGQAEAKKTIGNSLMMFSTSVVNEQKAINENCFLPNLTTGTEQEKPNDVEGFEVPQLSFLGNASVKIGESKKTGLGDTEASALHKSGVSAQKPDRTPDENSRASRIPKFSNEPSAQKSTKILLGSEYSESKPSSVSFLRQPKALDDSFKLSFCTSPPKQSVVSDQKASIRSHQAAMQSNESKSALSFLNTTEPTKQPDQEHKFAIFEDSVCNMSARGQGPKQPTSQSNQSLSFLNSTEPRKQPDQAQKFTIFEDSVCKKTAAPAEQSKQFAIFEDSVCKKSTTEQSKDFIQKKPAPAEQSKQFMIFEDSVCKKTPAEQSKQFMIFEDSVCKKTTAPAEQSKQFKIFEDSVCKKSTDEQSKQFAIFEDSACQKKPVPIEQQKQFAIFENSAITRKALNPQAKKDACFDVSCKSDEFFEDNIRTEAFATNLSMIKNSTWLPNHDPRQSRMSDQASNDKNDNSSGLSIFSNLSKQTSGDMGPPPPPQGSPPKVFRKPLQTRVTTPPPAPPVSECFEIAESDDEDDAGDLGKSIYTSKTPKTPKLVRHVWDPEAEEKTPENNSFVHSDVDLDHTQQVIDDYCVSADVNPFNRELMRAFLYQIDFTNYIEKLPTCDMVRQVRAIKKDSTVDISGKMFHVQKLVGEGSFGAVYCAKEPLSGRLFALKQERPANLWEYYICLELRSRLNSTEILPGFANIEYALIGNNAGILVTEFSRYGSLIAVCNKIKKETLKNVDEYVVMHMSSQLLLIMDHLHASNIIHGDVKPDNFLLMEKLVPGRKQPTIQLIDFGTSIDMDLFKKGQTFKYIHETESFKCPEMHEKRPWTYQLDLFGLAGVIHVLLFGKYMEIVRKPSGWTHKTHVPRYFNKSLWECIFHALLNIDNCQAMPNLQALRAQLEEEIAEKDKAVYQKIVEFNRALDARSSGSFKF